MRMRIPLLSLAVLVVTADRLDPASDWPFLTASAYVEVQPAESCTVLVTAYSSDAAQTDDTPTVTSAQTGTRWGVVAARWLPIGAKVKLPDRFGDEQVFVVEDRMPPKNWCKMDIWHQGAAAAYRFAKQFERVVVLNAPKGFACPALPLTVNHKCPAPATEWDKKAAQPVRIASVR